MYLTLQVIKGMSLETLYFNVYSFFFRIFLHSLEFQGHFMLIIDILALILSP